MKLDVSFTYIKTHFFNVAYLAQCLQCNQYSAEETQHQTSIYSQKYGFGGLRINMDLVPE